VADKDGHKEEQNDLGTNSIKLFSLKNRSKCFPDKHFVVSIPEMM